MTFIEIKDLSFGYKKDNIIINNINVSIFQNEITTITGSNGSGKTTLGKLMMGILKPLRGEIHILNQDINHMTLAQIGRKIGYLFQNPEKHFFTNRVEEELNFVLKLRGLDDNFIENMVSELLRLFQLEGLRNSSPLLLSQGEKQRLAIASILINEPKYLILDEPTTGLDIERKEILINVLRKLKNQGVGMTIISHDNLLIERLSQRVINIHKGEIVYDKRN